MCKHTNADAEELSYSFRFPTCSVYFTQLIIKLSRKAGNKVVAALAYKIKFIFQLTYCLPHHKINSTR